MAAALLTSAILALLTLVASVLLGSSASGGALSRHISLAVFGTFLTLLAYSMMMFYLIGKGRAIRDALTEGGLPQTPAAEFARLRKPVFSFGLVAMTLTMVTAILGASVDTGVLPAGVHATLAYSALAAGVLAIRAEIQALVAGGKIVSDVNEALAEKERPAGL